MQQAMQQPLQGFDLMQTLVLGSFGIDGSSQLPFPHLRRTL